MGKKFFMRPSGNVEQKLEELRAEVARLNSLQRTAVYSPPEQVEVKAVSVEVTPEPTPAVELPSFEDTPVFIPSAKSQGSADLKAVEKKSGKFELKNVESLKKQKGNS